MTRKRTDFTKKQKAEIFARDRATCAFSGISTWLFDYGIRPNFEIDWADHIKPSAKGGTSELSNGVCASSFFNAKKKDNGSDNKFFFQNGRITPVYTEVYGSAPQTLIADLERRAALRPIDWFVNRAVANTFFALDWRCELEFHGKEYKRDDEYYFKVAFNMLSSWIKDNSTPTIEARELLDQPSPFGSELLLQIQGVETQAHYLDWAEAIWPIYRLNWNVYKSFLAETSDEVRGQNLNAFAEHEHANPQMVHGLSQLLNPMTHQLKNAA